MPGTRALAVYNLERALKAYPVLTEGAAAPLLRAMAGLEPGAAGAGPDGWRRAAAGALPDLRGAAERAGERAAAAGAEPQSEAEEALAVGMPRLLGSGRSFWRLASGPDWAPLRALIASLLASAVHGGAGAQAEILGAAVTLGFRHVRPVVEDGPAVSQLVGDLVRCCLPVALGEGGMSDGLGDDEGVLGDKDALAAPAAMPWRYSLLAAALLGMLYESAPPESAARAAALQLRLLGSDLLLLRQAAIAPVLKGLLPVWKGAAYCAAQGADADGAVIVRAVRRGLANAGESCAGEASGATDALDSSLASLSASSEQLLLQNVDPPSVPSPPTADIAEAVRAALERGGAPLVRLIFARLAGNHAALAGGGAEADGGAPAGPQIGSTDEVIVRLVSSSLLRFALWPSGRERVGPLKDGAFKPEHAALAQALTAVAPELVLGALRDPLRAALEAAAQDADRQSTAAAAEALAGVLASGQALLVEAEGHDGAAPPRTAWEAWVRPLLRQALRRAPLDLVPQWAAGVLRYATYELATAGKLDALAQLCALVAEPAQEAEARGAEAGAAQAMVASASSPALVGAIGGGAVPAARSPPRAGHAAPSPAASPSPRPPVPGLPAAPPTTSAHFRRLTYVYHVLTEAVTVLGNREQPGFLLELWERLLLEAPGYASLPGQMVRTASSRLAALLISNALDCAALAASDQGSFVDAHASDSGRSVPQRREQLAWQCMGALASSFADSVAILAEDGGRFRRSSSSADVAAEDGESLADGAARGVARRLRLSRSQAAFGDADVVMGTAEDENEEEEATKADAGPETLAPEGDDVDLGEAAPRSESFDGSSAPGDEEGDDGSTRSRAGASPALSEGYLDPEPSPGSAVLMQSNAAVLGGVPRGPGGGARPAAIQHVAYCVEFASQVLQRGQAGALRRELARMLPGLLRIQRLIPSELQSVCLSARRALALLKYLPLAGDAEAVSLTLRALREACRSDIWTERAAALVYLQYFWFRHVLVLAHEGGTAALVGVVVERLADAKLEIRDLAAATLSGLIKGLDEREAAALRQSFLADAERLLPAKRRRPRGGAPAASPGPGAGAGLARAPARGQVLMALVRVAGEAGPVRTTVTKTLAEFRRTHEEAGLAEARDRLTSDQWEAIRDVANPAPYFV
ncbi:hypothetical protein QBZ16_005222 [Prototheca wickerhamii]|uniref:Proteasome activator complex subunit 4 C-terminal domain-containing protein n=1 Tax=Prototheca wickerhamii TaxID=3111 RepID=A0AAD9MGI4_PROWI|nr:hypothetical protein QBZ16_005222 [Prototheca wickerhamii]